MSGDLAVYVHWPYCAQKCPYCDFNSHVREKADDTRWANAIARELAYVGSLEQVTELVAPPLAPPPNGTVAQRVVDRTIWRGTPSVNGGRKIPRTPSVTSIFFGGGTPSLASGRAIGAVIDAVAAHWTIAPDAEITLEANPNSAEQARFRDYRAAGVNRVSIGVQALDDAALKSLGRLHDCAEARRAVALALAIFPRASFDLIYARPGQTSGEWKHELKDALGFGTEHLSLYQLTIEPGTAYATLARQGKLTIPNDDAAAALYDITQELCEAAGLPAYEISNHCRDGAQSRHNLNYWRYGDYVGVGPGAHGRLTVDGARVATQSERLPEHWLERVERDGHALTLAAISPDDAARENLLMTLRLSEGLDLAAYESRWNVSLDRDAVTELQEQGLLVLDASRIAATPKGRLVLNALIEKLAA
jgi:putative oxygen-independent coproporphyrinogen III oxidase